MRKLVVDEMEELRIFLILNDLTTPGGISAIVVMIGRAVVGIIEASVPGGRRKVETPAVRAKPAGITLASQCRICATIWEAKAVQATVFIGGACLYVGCG